MRVHRIYKSLQIYLRPEIRRRFFFFLCEHLPVRINKKYYILYLLFNRGSTPSISSAIITKLLKILKLLYIILLFRICLWTRNLPARVTLSSDTRATALTTHKRAHDDVINRPIYVIYSEYKKYAPHWNRTRWIT